LVGQIQAAGTGLNIQAASVVILCEPQIKPSLEVQAIARAHRMGQVPKVQVHRLILPESVDEQMLAMLAYKQSEFDDYARDSDLANQADGAKDASEESMAKVIVMEERKRLGINENDIEVQITDNES
jgi:SNF2 family DNA or RNA helicase